MDIYYSQNYISCNRLRLDVATGGDVIPS